MTTPASATGPVGPESLISVKVLYNDSTRRFKIPLKDLGSRVLPQKLRQLLGVPPDINVIFERFSDSAASYVRLDSENVAVYKQLYRAAKAKSKLRIKTVVVNLPRASTLSPVPPQRSVQETPTPMDRKAPTTYNYLGTVLDSPLPPPRAGAFPTAIAPTLNFASANNDTTAQSLDNNGVVPSQPQHRQSVLSSDDAGLPVISLTSHVGTYCVNCNNCSRSIPGEHYHCSICDNGDFDLCTGCLDAGVSCPAENHWLIKRFIKNGVISNSTTEITAQRKLQTKVEDEGKNAKESLPEPVADKAPEPSSTLRDLAVEAEKKTCNGCLQEHDESKMVTCDDCDNYHLCVKCLLAERHGHHPAHSFYFNHDAEFTFKNLAMSYCQPGRRYKHAAACDGCDKRIVGVRHKCLACPDWDYCAECIQGARQSHPGHRFVPIYESVAEPPRQYEIHQGIFCDGPLCKGNPSYVTGVRYKCAVCHDIDFCAKCEALSPNTHNPTHPLIKFKTPVRSVTVSIITDSLSGPAVAMGDRVHKGTSADAVAPAESEGIQEGKTEEKQPEVLEASEAADKTTAVPAEHIEAEKPTDSTQEFENQALFIRDSVADGTKLPPNKVFEQTWTLHNPGPLTWPAGSDVRFVGGDSMLNIDANQPSSLDSIMSAMESNKLSAPLEPGQNADFTVTLKTPEREGTAISYWRLKLPNGMALGARLWCDVQVQSEFGTIEKNEEKPAVNTSSEAPEVEKSVPNNSAMIFPLLDKESPTTSTHEGTARAPSAPTVSNASEKDILEDVEDLTLEDGDTEDGFLTDEEYDILDASDQEFLDAKQSQK